MDAHAAALQYLFETPETEMDFGLDRVGRVLARLGDPQQALKSILVGGTNGKGSTSAFLFSILRQHGLRVGMYTSPHLMDVEEHIQAGSGGETRRIPRDDFCKKLSEVRIACAEDVKLSFFEKLTVVAFLYFREQQLDWLVAEVGLGGRLDATNVLDPRVSIVTNVALEHQEYLGNTCEAIGGEKFMIGRPGRPLITAIAQKLQPWAAVFCREQKFQLRILGKDFHAREVLTIPLGLRGNHQRQNAACALEALRTLEAQGLILDAQKVAAGLREARWPGRLELWRVRHAVGTTEILLDGAHNPAGMAVLLPALKELKFSPETVLFSCRQDKDIRGVLGALAPLRVPLWFQEIPGLPRAVTGAGWADWENTWKTLSGCSSTVLPGTEQWMRWLAEHHTGRLLVTGSLYLVGTIRRKLLQLEQQGTAEPL